LIDGPRIGKGERTADPVAALQQRSFGERRAGLPAGGADWKLLRRRGAAEGAQGNRLGPDTGGFLFRDMGARTGRVRRVAVIGLIDARRGWGIVRRGRRRLPARRLVLGRAQPARFLVGAGGRFLFPLWGGIRGGIRGRAVHGRKLDRTHRYAPTWP